jgi:hypothetical protein
MEAGMASLYGTAGRVRLRDENATFKDRLASVVKAIPTEVVSVYLLGKTIGPDYEMWWTLVCWVLVLIARWMVTDGNGKTLNIILAMIAFPLWVMATGGTIVGYAFPEQITGLLVLLFSVAAGWLYNDEPPTT